MPAQVLFTLAVIFFFGLVSCNNYAAVHPQKNNWISVIKVAPGTRIGKQMPPHHEPDAVLINTGRRGYGIPGASYPDIPMRPGIYGIPGVSGGPYGPGTFGVSGFGGGPYEPGTFGVSGFGGGPSGGIPYLPGGFGMPGDMPYLPNVFGIQTGTSGVSPQFYTPDHRGVRAFAGAGSGNFPFSFDPRFFIHNFPGMPENYPETRDGKPNTFVPSKRNGFSPREILPGVFYPEKPSVLFPPDSSSNPRNDFGGSEGREVVNESTARIFPRTEKSP